MYKEVIYKIAEEKADSKFQRFVNSVVDTTGGAVRGGITGAGIGSIYGLARKNPEMLTGRIKTGLGIGAGLGALWGALDAMDNQSIRDAKHALPAKYHSDEDVISIAIDGSPEIAMEYARIREMQGEDASLNWVTTKI